MIQPSRVERLPPLPPRRVWVLFPHEPLLCARGHRQDKHVWSMGALATMGGERCRKSDRNGECGACLFWWLLPDGSRLVAEVSSKELHDMEAAHMDVRGSLEYLGLRQIAA